MNVDANKEIFAQIVLNNLKQELYNIRICGKEKTNTELYDINSLYLKIKAIETCQ